MTGNLGQFESDWRRPVSESSLLLTEPIHGVGAGGSQRCDEHSLFLPIVGKRMMQEVARGQPNGLAAFDNGADDVGCQEGIADCLAHAVRWDGVFGCNLLIGFACFDSVEPGEGVGDIAQECAVDGFRGVAQNELGLDAASTQAERCEDAECILANAVRSHREASSERIAVEQDGHRAGADVDPPDKTEQGGCRGTIIISTGTQPV